MDRSVQNGSVHLGSHTNRDKTALYDCEQLVSGLSVTLVRTYAKQLNRTCRALDLLAMRVWGP